MGIAAIGIHRADLVEITVPWSVLVRLCDAVWVFVGSWVRGLCSLVFTCSLSFLHSFVLSFGAFPSISRLITVVLVGKCPVSML